MGTSWLKGVCDFKAHVVVDVTCRCGGNPGSPGPTVVSLVLACPFFVIQFFFSHHEAAVGKL